MSHKAKVNGVVYNITSGLTKKNGQVLSIKYGKTKENGVVKTISLSAGRYVGIHMTTNEENSTSNYIEVNYIDGSYRRLSATGNYYLSDVKDLIFNAYAPSVIITLNGDVVATEATDAASPETTYTWVPAYESIRVSFDIAKTSVTITITTG